MRALLRVNPRHERHVIHTRTGRTVVFSDVGLARAIERVLTEEPPGECGPMLEMPEGWYSVKSRTMAADSETAFWQVHLDPDTGELAHPHNCTARAENPQADVACRHIALASLAWREQRDQANPFRRRVGLLEEQEHSMSGSTALAALTALPSSRAMTHIPTAEDVSATLALANVFMTTRGAAIPYQLDTPAKIAAVIIAGQELGFEPMMALANLYIVNGATALRSQGMLAKVHEYGGDVDFHQDDDEACEATIRMPGKSPYRKRVTIEWAQKRGLVKSVMRRKHDKQGKEYGEPYETSPWVLWPEDMLVAKCVARLCRRKAPHIINGIEGSMVRLGDVLDQAPARYSETDEERREALALTTMEDEEDWPTSDAGVDTSEVPTDTVRPSLDVSSPENVSNDAAGSAQTEPEATGSTPTELYGQMPYSLATLPALAWLEDRLAADTGNAVKLTGKAATAGEKWLCGQLSVTVAVLAKMPLVDVLRRLTGAAEPEAAQAAML